MTDLGELGKCIESDYAEIENAIIAVHTLKDGFLRRRGWEPTYEIASLWLWKKTLADGRVLLLSMADAISMETSY